MTKPSMMLIGQAGMPNYPVSRPLGWFEFLPALCFYTPVVVQSIGLGLYYRSLTLPLIANPGISLSGMVGEAKSEVFAQAGDTAQPYIAAYWRWTRPNAITPSIKKTLLAELAKAGITMPLVAKPDKGCRGAGVQRIDTEKKLFAYIRTFPPDRDIIFQALAPYDAEAGVFYIRYPGEERGQLFSLGLKYLPAVIGDGRRTLAALIQHHDAASVRGHLYHQRHHHQLDEVIPAGVRIPLAFSGSHCRGAIFKDGAAWVTPALTAKIDTIAKDINGFYFGRFDIKFRDIASLQQGKGLCIVEINGASSEPAHIWDSEGGYFQAIRALLHQYRHLYHIGARLRLRGHQPPSVFALLRAWYQERRWMKQYPGTD
ncbi:ATP-grasp domain-containing protein [Salinivibrio kushneri]|uniref:D-alanine--D-alanine ligase n=1 Tax=Salinivibrio kushneri TaxID=1908198 RepID=UPI000C8420AF|nr:D-alanine--D-alanine ligase [Salinivibrio kushneri]